jgi:hypothetical protein
MLNDVCLEVNPVGKPDAVAPHVRFDERGRETGLQCYRARPRLYWPAFFYKYSKLIAATTSQAHRGVHTGYHQYLFNTNPNAYRPCL